MHKKDPYRALLFLIVLFSCLIFPSSCGLLCVDANLSPATMIRQNDYVILGDLVSTDTLAYLGNFDFLGNEESGYIIEYTFKPREIFKGNKETEYIFLWFCVEIRLKDNYDNGLACDTITQLIYGREVRDWDSIIYIYTQNLVWDGRILTLRDWLKGIEPKAKWAAAEGDSTVVSRIVASTDLKQILEERNQVGRVIYATESGYYTHDSFCRDELVYCDCMWCPPRLFVSQSDYLGKLRKLGR